MKTSTNVRGIRSTANAGWLRIQAFSKNSLHYSVKTSLFYGAYNQEDYFIILCKLYALQIVLFNLLFIYY